MAEEATKADDDADGAIIATAQPDALRQAFGYAIAALIEALPPGTDQKHRVNNRAHRDRAAWLAM